MPRKKMFADISRQSTLPDLEIIGLFNRNINYKFSFQDNCKIIVGPNGDGKSTALLIVYLTLSQQWQRLSAIDFDEVRIRSTDCYYYINISELRSLNGYLDSGVINPPRATYRESHHDELYRTAYQNLEIDPIIEYCTTKLTSVSSSFRIRYEEAAQTLSTTFSRLLDAQRYVKALDLPLVMYLPTYRRIERDIKEVIPELDARLRRAFSEEDIPIRFGKHYTEIVNFGMRDIESLIDKTLDGAKEFELKRISQLAAEYISGIVSNEYLKLDARLYTKSLFENNITNNLLRLQKSEFMNYSLENVTNNITKIHSKKRVSNRDKQIAFFYKNVQDAFSEVDKKLEKLEKFTKTVNKYISPSKEFRLNFVNLELELESEYGKVRLSDLSSGEKQIVSLFAHLYIAEVNQFILLIDEPELSLSVIWQENLVEDILDSDRVYYLTAVTHSPFIFNHLSKGQVTDTVEMRIE